MKKSMVALAVLSAFAGAASAQSSVTLYGTLDVGMSKASGGNWGINNAGSGGGLDSTSVIGFRGQEDLGGGLMAKFNLQSGGLNLDTGSNTVAFSREANVGFAGGFGEVTLGRTSSVATKSTGGFDLNGVANTSPLVAVGISPVTAYGSSRRSDQVQYASPDMGGVKVRFGLTLKNDSTPNGALAANTTAQNRSSFAVNYGDAMFSVGGVVETKASNAVGKTVGSNNMNLMGLGAKVNFGAAIASLSYTKRESEDSGKGFALGLAVPMDGMTAGVQFAKNQTTGAKATELFAKYSLSKRTTLYTEYLSANQPAMVALPSGAPQAKASSKSAGFGVIHTF